MYWWVYMGWVVVIGLDGLSRVRFLGFADFGNSDPAPDDEECGVVDDHVVHIAPRNAVREAVI